MYVAKVLPQANPRPCLPPDRDRSRSQSPRPRLWLCEGLRLSQLSNVYSCKSKLLGACPR